MPGRIQVTARPVLGGVCLVRGFDEVARTAARMEGQPFEAAVREAVHAMLDLHRPTKS